MLTVAVGRGRHLTTLSTSGFVDDVMFLHNQPYMAHGVGNNDMGAVMQQVVKISNIFARLRHAV